MKISISVDALERANSALKALQGAFPRAVSSAVNRTLEGMRTDAVSETKSRYFVKASDVRKTITLKKTSAGSLNGAMVSKGSRRSLADYNLTPKIPRRGQQGLKGAVKRDGIKSIERGFLIKRAGKYKPYMRIGAGKWALQPLISPAVPQIIKNEETVKIMEEKASERFGKRLDHEVKRLLGAL